MYYAPPPETLAVPPIPYANDMPEEEVLIRAAGGKFDSPCMAGKSRYKHAARRHVGGRRAGGNTVPSLPAP